MCLCAFVCGSRIQRPPNNPPQALYVFAFTSSDSSTAQHVIKRGMRYVGLPHCAMCKRSNEIFQSFFFHLHYFSNITKIYDATSIIQNGIACGKLAVLFLFPKFYQQPMLEAFSVKNCLKKLAVADSQRFRPAFLSLSTTLLYSISKRTFDACTHISHTLVDSFVLASIAARVFCAPPRIPD